MFFPALVGKSTGVSIPIDLPIDLPIEAILIPGLTEVGGSSTGRPARNAWAKWNGPKVYAARWRRWVRWVRWVQRTIFQPSAFWWVVWLPFPGLKVVKICKNDIVLPRNHPFEPYEIPWNSHRKGPNMSLIDHFSGITALMGSTVSKLKAPRVKFDKFGCHIWIDLNMIALKGTIRDYFYTTSWASKNALVACFLVAPPG